jgi:hypothetical protein
MRALVAVLAAGFVDLLVALIIVIVIAIPMVCPCPAGKGRQEAPGKEGSQPPQGITTRDTACCQPRESIKHLGHHCSSHRSTLEKRGASTGCLLTLLGP